MNSAGNENIVLTAKITVKDGKEAEFETVMKNIVPEVRAEKGNLAYTMCRSRKNPRVFLFFEEYVDQAALEAHGKHLGEMKIDFGAYFEGPPQAEYFVKIAE
jgi:quinol monooxygenase YgiN